MLIVFIIAAFVGGCLRANPELYPENEEEREVTAYVTGHGWHTGIVVDRGKWFEYADSLEGYPQGDYLEFGWGDKDFFMDQTPGVWTYITAAFWPTTTVIHISAFSSSPEERFTGSDVVEISLTEEGLKGMVEFIDDRMHRSDGELQVAGSGLYGPSVFVDSKGRYILPYTCNVWTGRALRAAGFPITPLYAVGRRNTIWQVSREGTVLQER